jgi:EpsI family protein
MSDEHSTAGRMITRRKFALGLAFASAAGVAAARQPHTRLDYLGANKLDKVLPEQLGRWTFVSSSGLVVPPEDQLERALYSQLLTRVYENRNGAPIMLLVAQSAVQSGILQIHRPEICYTAGGYRLSAVEPHVVSVPWGTIPALSMSAANGERTEHLVYWTRIGDHLPRSWREQRLAVAMDNLRGIIPDAVMIRVSTISNDKVAALSMIDEFIGTMLQSVSPQLRKVLMS